MKKKIAILGSTGSIGATTLKIVSKNLKNFDIILLSTHSNAEKLLKQSKKFNVKNVIIINNKKYLYFKNKFQKNNIKVFNNFENFNKIFNNKLDYVMSAITGIDGLYPSLNIIKHTKKIAIANKESIICGWNLINKELKKHKTNFIPVDSEHFSIYELTKNQNINNIKKIIITASGGPFLNKRAKKIKVKDALKHPNWKMGKKISIDSATLMNKVFEVIEAKKIFKLDFKKIDILINPNSYLHSIIILKNGTIKMLAHETKMDIPIHNSLYENCTNQYFDSNELDLKKINNINLIKPKTKFLPILKLINLIPKNDSLFETILISVNDELVNLFLKNKISYKDLLKYLIKIIKFKKFKKYCNVKPKSINDIYKINYLAKKYVHENIFKR